MDERRYSQCYPPWATEQLARNLWISLRGNAPEQLQQLSGGFHNGNFRADSSVLRLYSGGPEVAYREASVLELARAGGVPVPRVEEVGEFEGRGFTVQEFVSGARWTKDSNNRDMGRVLAGIHAIRLEGPGLFRPDGTVRKFEPLEGWNLLRRYLEGNAGSRLGDSTVERLLALEPPDQTGVHNALVHADFNFKNLLTRPDGRVAAVLDWEFAMVNSPLIDLGNYFRFASDHTPQSTEEFLRGYTEAGGVLDEGWRRQARLHDLVSLLDFLNHPEEKAETFRTARRLVEETLQVLG